MCHVFCGEFRIVWQTINEHEQWQRSFLYRIFVSKESLYLLHNGHGVFETFTIVMRFRVTHCRFYRTFVQLIIDWLEIWWIRAEIINVKTYPTEYQPWPRSYNRVHRTRCQSPCAYVSPILSCFDWTHQWNSSKPIDGMPVRLVFDVIAIFHRY